MKSALMINQFDGIPIFNFIFHHILIEYTELKAVKLAIN